MTHRYFAALVASLILSLASVGAQALPPIDFCDENPDSPLCVPVDPEPGDGFCDRFPESPICEEPPVDPGDPEPPISFCDRFPESPICNPEEEPPVIDPCPSPTSCLPTFPNNAALTGSAKVKGEDFNATEAFELQVNFDDATFLAIDGDTVYFGNLSPKGPSGKKFQLFLDDGSSDAFSADVAARAATASGRAAGSVLGDSSKIILKLKSDGSASLKIKSNVLVTGIGEVVFKANLIGPVTQ
jgi:hypothetical protein